jgi:hypothetical protein
MDVKRMPNGLDQLEKSILQIYCKNYPTEEGFDPNKILSARLGRLIQEGLTRTEALLDLLGQEGTANRNERSDESVSEK